MTIYIFNIDKAEYLVGVNKSREGNNDDDNDSDDDDDQDEGDTEHEDDQDYDDPDDLEEIEDQGRQEMIYDDEERNAMSEANRPGSDENAHYNNNKHTTAFKSYNKKPSKSGAKSGLPSFPSPPQTGGPHFVPPPGVGQFHPDFFFQKPSTSSLYPPSNIMEQYQMLNKLQNGNGTATAAAAAAAMAALTSQQIKLLNQFYYNNNSQPTSINTPLDISSFKANLISSFLADHPKIND